ncbi:MAG: peptidoglycan-associated lipoprotein Pal [Candidatus Eisenbacteria bacterium]|nr:peptidoglycan-associated lipoprotein Pal [Candidatus Latescibacterota bacterium]MBD3301996.1 peptidoglycan-associated lipoprotein Pal [Candidatus Eisenbacteria bacterium]
MNRIPRGVWAWTALLVVCALVVAPGCSKKPKPPTDVTQQETPPPEPPSEPEAPETDEPADRDPMTEIEDVFFDYDRYNLREDARRTLEQNAQILSNNPDLMLTLEGHCDERGTVEYNLALGERRAQSVKDYLVQFGIDASRLRTISYGEERPFAQGHTESAWSKNRRVHFVER